MKKCMMFAVVMLAATMAQAITADWKVTSEGVTSTAAGSTTTAWSQGETTSTYSAALPQACWYYAGQDYSVAATLIVPTLPTSSSANTVLFKAGNNAQFSYVSLEVTSSGDLILVEIGRNSTSRESITLATNVTAGSTIRVAWSYDRDSSNTEASSIVAYYNGTRVGTLSPQNWLGQTQTIYTDSPSSIVEISGYSALLTDSDVQAMLLPEPTCLALLALGVAGLALRRKAA